MVLPVPIADRDRERERERGQGADAAQAAQPAHDRGELGLGGHDGDLCIQPVASSLDLQDRIVVRLEGHPGRRGAEPESVPADLTQPGIVLGGPGVAAGVHQSLAATAAWVKSPVVV